MKLTKQKLFYLIENIIKENKSDNLLKLLINLKKLGGPDEFFKRFKVDYSDPMNSTVFYFNLLFDNEVVGTVSYDLISPTASFQCKPDPIKEDEKVFVLKTIARDPDMSGYGIGKLVSFLSVCILNHNSCWVTSDRNTSQEAGKNLTSALKMMKTNKSKPFDYVGWFKTTIQQSIEDGDGMSIYMTGVPEDFRENAGVKRYIQNLYNKIASDSMQDQLLKQAYIKKVVIPLLKKLDNHLVPLTAD